MALRVRKNPAVIPSICAFDEGIGVLRGAWAPDVIMYLRLQPRRFGELRVDLPAISARVLSARLRELEGKGVLTRRAVPGTPPSVEYALTELGHELVPAILALARIGMKVKAREGLSPDNPTSLGPARRAAG